MRHCFPLASISIHLLPMMFPLETSPINVSPGLQCPPCNISIFEVISNTPLCEVKKWDFAMSPSQSLLFWCLLQCPSPSVTSFFDVMTHPLQYLLFQCLLQCRPLATSHFSTLQHQTSQHLTCGCLLCNASPLWCWKISPCYVIILWFEISQCNVDPLWCEISPASLVLPMSSLTTLSPSTISKVVQLNSLCRVNTSQG